MPGLAPGIFSARAGFAGLETSDTIVMAGLGPAIHDFPQDERDVDARDNPPVLSYTGFAVGTLGTFARA